jgi:hypothetical protein
LIIIVKMPSERVDYSKSIEQFFDRIKAYQRGLELHIFGTSKPYPRDQFEYMPNSALGAP